MSESQTKPKNSIKFKPIFTVLVIVSIIWILSILTMYSLTPKNFVSPKSDHAHFRMQYIFMGQLEDFGSPRYQVDYIKDVCSSGLTESPIHFHDNLNQIVHLHWQKVTGGQVLKFYGLNKIGGINNTMGWKLDDLLKFKLTPVPIHSDSLPEPRKDDKIWVYTGEKDNYQKRDFNDFVNQDLEVFFNKNSQVREQFEQAASLSFNPFSIKAEAHSGIDHQNLSEEEQHQLQLQKEKIEIEKKNNQANISLQENQRQQSQAIPLATDTATTPSKEELKQINNLLGDVIIFVQPDEPSGEQINLRFENLQPLQNSVCGG